MAKSAKKSIKQRSCNRHSFSLRPCAPNQHHPIHLHASFCQTPADPHIPQNPKIKQQSCINCPTFNRDRQPSTPTFVLTHEANQTLGKSIPLRYEYQNQMILQQCEKSELNIPKPRSKNNYCSICRDTYEDYLSHIHLKTHQNAIRQNPFNHHILALAQNCKRRIPISRQVKMEKQVEVTEVDDSDEVEIVENPVRKVKHTEVGIASPRWGWQEQPTTDYAKQFVAIFRGMNYQYAGYSCFMNPFAMPNFPHQSFSFLSLPPMLFPSDPRPARKPRELTYIIIDE